MTTRNWLITGVSSGFGRELATQLLDRGDTVVGTVRRPDSVADLLQKYPDTFHRELLDVTDGVPAKGTRPSGFKENLEPGRCLAARPGRRGAAAPRGWRGDAAG